MQDVFVLNKDTLIWIYRKGRISLSLSKRYPIPIFAIIGLLFGIITLYGFNNAELGHLIWFIVLVIGGLPIIFETIDLLRN
jgi:hypothetical protein